MKSLVKLTFILLACTSISMTSFAQWTNSGSSLHTNDNVGINTSSPSAALDVIGIIKGTRTGGPATFILNRTDGKAVSVAASTTGGTFRFDATGKFKIQSQAAAGILAGNATNIVDVAVIESAPANSFFLKSSGYLGIGTKTPTERLHVIGNSRVTGKLQLGTADRPSNYTLSVDGKAICEEVFVELSSAWPDYVFQREYNLMPLSDLAQYIDKEGHLPKMPSASQIEAEGSHALGETQRLLLEKIEELTLYILELDKKNTVLSEELNNLKKNVGNSQ